MLWTDDSVPFPFGKDGSGILANCSLCGTEATLFVSAGPICSSFSAEACTILHAFCWSQQHQQDFHFSSLVCLLLCPCHFVFSIFPFTLISGRNCFLSHVLSGYNRSSDTCFSRAMTQLMSWPDKECYLLLSAIPCSLSSLISRIHSSLFLDRRHTVSEFFNTGTLNFH